MELKDRKQRMGFAEFYDPQSPFDHSLVAARWYFFQIYLEHHPSAAEKLRLEGLSAWRRMCEPHPCNTLSGAFFLWSMGDIGRGRAHLWARQGLSAVNAVVVTWLREQQWPSLLESAAYPLFALSALNAVAAWEDRGSEVVPGKLPYLLVHIQDTPHVDYDAILNLPEGIISLHYYPCHEFWDQAKKRIQWALKDRKLCQTYRHAIEGVYERAGWYRTPTKRCRVLTPRIQFDHTYAYLTMPDLTIEKMIAELGTSVEPSTFRQNVGSILDYLLYGTHISNPLPPRKPVRKHVDALAL